jgi:hypothetical protein
MDTGSDVKIGYLRGKGHKKTYETDGKEKTDTDQYCVPGGADGYFVAAALAGKI